MWVSLYVCWLIISLLSAVDVRGKNGGVHLSAGRGWENRVISDALCHNKSPVAASSGDQTLAQKRANIRFYFIRQTLTRLQLNDHVACMDKCGCLHLFSIRNTLWRCKYVKFCAFSLLHCPQWPKRHLKRLFETFSPDWPTERSWHQLN